MKICFKKKNKTKKQKNKMSTNEDNFSDGPSHPDTIGLPTGVGLCILARVYNSGIRGGLGV